MFQAVRNSIYGKPGACYLDIPGDMLANKVEEEKVMYVPHLAVDLSFYS